MSDIPFSIRPNGISSGDVAETYATIAELNTKEDILTFNNDIFTPFFTGKIERTGDTITYFSPDFSPYLTISSASSTYATIANYVSNSSLATTLTSYLTSAIASSTYQPIIIPYYIEIGIGANTGGVFRSFHNVGTKYNTLYTISTPISTYNSDLNSSIWSPSVAGLFLINFQVFMRSVNQDYLVEGLIQINKQQAGGGYVAEKLFNLRNWGTSVNEADARVFTMTMNISHTVYAIPTDDFDFNVLGLAYFGNDIWTDTRTTHSKITITKLY
tara:strand:+ start:521 stop:1336 length:816 start_codon:yes stop_codon:yes gene_type:complete